MKTVMITIKPRHLNNMRKGVKAYELRKSRPAVTPPFRVLCCVSASGGRVDAEFTCTACPQLDSVPDGKTAQMAHITADEVRGYREKGGALYGWKVEDFRDIPERHAVDYGLKRPPQSWCYVKEAVHDG